MKRIAVFCDGTWNSPDRDHPTNVQKLCALTPQIAGEQETVYIRGVGARQTEAGQDLNWLDKQIDRLGGGAFGWGLEANLREAYTKLAERYAPGDQVMIFGFSRGAFTARSLAGLIRNCGIPGPDTIGSIPEAMALYRDRDPEAGPDAPRSLRFREDFSPVATSKIDQDSRDAPEAVTLYRTAYLGVWDTVGALGVPADFTGLAKVFNGKYKFHDTDLSSSVAMARHAVAIDERRRTFPPTLWNNLYALNITNPPEPGKAARYQQLWFPGVHGAVGGGGDRHGLSDATLYWVGLGAREAGLTLAPGFDDLVSEINPADPLNNSSKKPGWLGTVLARFLSDRLGPQDPTMVSKLTRRRFHMTGLPDNGGVYNPKTLSSVRPVLRIEQPPGDLDV